MTGEQVRAALHAGRRVYGSCLTNPSVWAALKYTELDFVFIDNEHAPLGRESTMALCQVFKARQIAPVVRIPEADPTLAGMALDAGAEGIICPYVEDPAIVRAVAGAVRYRPLKGRRLDEFLKSGEGLDAPTRQYLEDRNRHSFLIINVESTPAIERLDELLAVPGLDAVLIGPHDLSISLGIPEQYAHPNFIAAAERIIARARAAGLGAGLHYWESLDRELHYIRQGANLIVHSTDITESVRVLNADLAYLRKQMEDRRSERAGPEVTI